MNKFFLNINALLILTLLFASCSKDDGTTTETDTETVDSETQKINKFVLDNMDFVYYWTDNMEQLNYKTESDTYEMFDKLLDASYDSELDRNIDQWSFITDDYQGLLDYFSGVRLTMGHSIRLYRIFSDSEDLVGFIEYVEPNSPASEAGLERGDMFYMIDDQVLTISNYSTLLDQDSYTMTLGSFNSDYSINSITPSIDLTAVELNTNPIHLSKVIDYEGTKVGYLMYKSFIADYDSELEDVFTNFKAQGVTELVLDLRYNGGGSVATAINLASMIAPASAVNDVFITTDYNTSLTNYYNQKYPSEEDLYTDRIESKTNNLDLDRLVVLTTYKTASASEMVIYGLSPYMTVYQIGEQTHGKYYGSITVSDEDEHNWAIQPIVLRAENKDNSIDYRYGLIPNEERYDFLNSSVYYPLGDEREDFLAVALEYLTGIAPTGVQLKSAKRPLIPTNTEEKLSHPLQNDMHFNLK